MPKTCLLIALSIMSAVSVYFGWLGEGPSMPMWQKAAYFTLGFLGMSALLCVVPDKSDRKSARQFGGS